MAKDTPLKFCMCSPGTVLTWPWKSLRKLGVVTVLWYTKLFCGTTFTWYSYTSAPLITKLMSVVQRLPSMSRSLGFWWMTYCHLWWRIYTVSHWFFQIPDEVQKILDDDSCMNLHSEVYDVYHSFMILWFSPVDFVLSQSISQSCWWLVMFQFKTTIHRRRHHLWLGRKI